MKLLPFCFSVFSFFILFCCSLASIFASSFSIAFLFSSSTFCFFCSSFSLFFSSIFSSISFNNSSLLSSFFFLLTHSSVCEVFLRLLSFLLFLPFFEGDLSAFFRLELLLSECFRERDFSFLWRLLVDRERDFLRTLDDLLRDRDGDLFRLRERSFVGERSSRDGERDFALFSLDLERDFVLFSFDLERDFSFVLDRL